MNGTRKTRLVSGPLQIDGPREVADLGTSGDSTSSSIEEFWSMFVRLTNDASDESKSKSFRTSAERRAHRMLDDARSVQGERDVNELLHPAHYATEW